MDEKPEISESILREAMAAIKSFGVDGLYRTTFAYKCRGLSTADFNLLVSEAQKRLEHG